ncbi:hypothetical protein [Vibrio phage vB_VpaP_SJSY21]|nr:hypothetical protein [Vibrio phage vB_VpaP_SJSY21]
MIYKAKELSNWSSQALYGGKWVPARPLHHKSISGLYMRLQAAFGVLTGKYDAVDWEH